MITFITTKVTVIQDVSPDCQLKDCRSIEHKPGGGGPVFQLTKTYLAMIKVKAIHSAIGKD